MQQSPVALTNEMLWDFVKEHTEDLKELPSEIDYDLDFTKEFRFKNYPILLLVLKNALREFISTVAPNPEEEFQQTSQRGFLYVYDGKVPNYMQDHIKWKKTRMSVKLIVYSKSKGIYKLKNHKTDEGVSVMRRQTWQSDGWRKNEYKLINRETYYKPEADGTFSVNECQTLQDFPVLVHYFRKEDGNGTQSKEISSKSPSKTNNTVKRRRVKTINESDDEIPESSSYIELNSDVPPVPNMWVSNFPTSPTMLFNLNVPAVPNSPGFSSLVKDELCVLPAEFLRSRDSDPLTPAKAAMSIPMAVPTSTMEIKSYAPDSGPASECTKIIVVVQGWNFQVENNKDDERPFACFMDGEELPVKVLLPGCLELVAPSHQPGVVQFWITCRTSDGNVQYSNAVFFYFTPSDDAGKLNLAFHSLSSSDLVSRDIFRHFRHSVRELDLSNNLLTDLDFLSEFHQLVTLTLDNNQISESSRLPSLPKLVALYVNSNLISTLEPFVSRLALACPSLQYFSFLGNEACPYLSKLPHQYYNYRIYVISKLRKLTQLDSSPVTPEETRHASCIINDDEMSGVNDVTIVELEDHSLEIDHTWIKQER
eukprot:TRINITY_DN6402_c0_g1_i4.p1 TRINITY_DN6402_c0_g1~~TRINITY_DN6402_c0_g1_i4.p1  ORF type:complete len:594 (-),score=154.90 TRINITY_DN6402_c0_g1_i4:50-1831(-)